MGRTSIAKQRKIKRLRSRGHTDQEIAKKLKLTVRTVNKYDPLREKRVGPTAKQLEFLEACRGLVAIGLAEESDEKFRISPLGKRLCTRWEELKDVSILRFMMNARRPVAEEEISRHLDGISDRLFNQALDEVKRRYS